MRRRYRRHRSRAAFSSKPFRPLASVTLCCIRSGPEHVVGRPILDLVPIFASPIDHVRQPLVPADLRLPADLALDRARVEPVTTVLAETIAGYFTELIERNLHRAGHALDH